MWYSGVACMIVMIIGMMVSIVDKHESDPVDPDLLAPGVETLFCCWPKKLKKWIAVKQMFSSHRYPKEDCTIELEELRRDGD